MVERVRTASPYDTKKEREDFFKTMIVAVFDTETAGVHTQTLLNVGYQIIDINPKTFEVKVKCKRDYIVRDVFRNNLFMLNDKFVGVDKFHQMEQNVNSGGAILRTIEQIFMQMKTDFMRHQVVSAYAYNSDFDVDKFTQTANQSGISNPLDGYPVFDLWSMAFNFICAKEDYTQFCCEHNLYTESKRFWKTSVESVTAYLQNDPDFKEDHTALSDTEWELKILIECLRRGANPFGLYARSPLYSGYVFTKRLIIDGKEQVIHYRNMSTKWDKEDTIEFT